MVICFWKTNGGHARLLVVSLFFFSLFMVSSASDKADDPPQELDGLRISICVKRNRTKGLDSQAHIYDDKLFIIVTNVSKKPIVLPLTWQCGVVLKKGDETYEWPLPPMGGWCRSMGGWSTCVIKPLESLIVKKVAFATDLAFSPPKDGALVTIRAWFWVGQDPMRRKICAKEGVAPWAEKLIATKPEQVLVHRVDQTNKQVDVTPKNDTPPALRKKGRKNIQKFLATATVECISLSKVTLRGALFILSGFGPIVNDLTNQQQGKSKLITLDVSDIPLKKALSMILEQSGIPNIGYKIEDDGIHIRIADSKNASEE